LPAGQWALSGYTDPSPATGCAQVANFAGLNVPPQYAGQQTTCNPQGGVLWTTVEYAVAVSPVANTPMCSPTTNIAVVSGAVIEDTQAVLPPAQSESSVTEGMDLGDLPDPNYPTLLASDGARHYITSPLRL